MRRDRCAYLRDMFEAADSIFLFVAGLSFDSFESVDLIQSAVERKFEIIGEAIRQASRFFPGSMDSIPDLREVVGQRNHIAHGYFEVNPRILWNSIQTDLPKFQKEVERLIEESCPHIRLAPR
ncbi:MAG: DUF86 domain-containing protein [Acidobacteriota bacterium]|nr:DUF86 domain-containing protein [Acidobacteriota bacterium]